MFPLHYLLSLLALLAKKTMILLRFVTCKNPTYSIAQCQYIFEVEDFHSKHCMDKVYAVLKRKKVTTTLDNVCTVKS